MAYIIRGSDTEVPVGTIRGPNVYRGKLSRQAKQEHPAATFFDNRLAIDGLVAATVVGNLVVEGNGLGGRLLGMIRGTQVHFPSGLLAATITEAETPEEVLAGAAAYVSDVLGLHTQ